jgi:hypothetical protein
MRAIRQWGSLIVSALALLAAGSALFVERAAGAQDAPIKERLARVETQQTAYTRDLASLNTRLERIEDKLDRVLLRGDSGGWQDGRGGR